MKNSKHVATQRIVAKINNTEIVVIENGEKRVAIKPICEALGIDYPTQFTKLKSDPILSSTVGLSPMVGSDKKEREMSTIPFRYVFGWLFRIDSRNVKEESREFVLKYQLACYNALYNYFASINDFLQERQAEIDERLEELETIRKNFNSAKDQLKEANDALTEARKFTYDHWLAKNAQQSINFPEDSTNPVTMEE